MNWLHRYHAARIHTRRVEVVAAAAARLLPPACARVLDVGCGDGRIAETVRRLRPGLEIVGAEIAPRAGCRVPVTAFDGRTLPFGDASFDAVVMVDVLHHLTNCAPLLHEAARVSRGPILLKDHLREGLAARTTLRFMDWVGNAQHKVPLPYAYLNRAEWAELFAACGLAVEETDPVGRLYPFPARLVFGRGLHFFSRLVRRPRR